MGLALLAAPSVWAADAAAPAIQQATSVAVQLIAALDRVFQGPHAGERAIHAKGVVARGDFTAGPDAMSLSTAEHLRTGGPPVPVVVRLSDFSGVPAQIDGKPGTNPAGMSIKFLLSGGVDTDIVAHAYNGFPVATPLDFLGYLNALVTTDTATRDAFFAGHPAAKRFLDDPKPTPASYGTEAYFGVDAFRFTNAAAVARFGRYRIEPVAGEQHLTANEAGAIKPNYLDDELHDRLKSGPVSFRLFVQLAAPEDAVADATTPWPADRPEILLGTLALTQIVDNPAETKNLFFSPMNLVPGIAASPDPLLAARTRSYAISYRRRLAGD